MDISLSEVFRRIGGAVCHQIPARSLSFDGQPLPLCARCTGIYLSVLCAAAGFFLFRGRPRRTVGRRAFLVYALSSALGFLPMMIDGIANATGLWNTNAFIRTLTGALFGMSLTAFFVLIRLTDIRHPVFRLPVDRACKMAVVWVTALAGALSVYAAPAAAGRWYGAVLPMAVLFALSGFFYLLTTAISKNSGFWPAVLSCAGAWGWVGLTVFFFE